jgi:hypothetical protein
LHKDKFDAKADYDGQGREITLPVLSLTDLTDRDPDALAKTVERVISFPDDIQLYGSSDPLSHSLCSHDNGGMRIGPRHVREDRAIDHPQAGEALHAPVLIHYRHRV